MKKYVPTDSGQRKSYAQEEKKKISTLDVQKENLASLKIPTSPSLF